RHVVVQNLDRQVFPLLTEHCAGLLLHDGTCTVVRIHHLVADLVQAEPPLFVAYIARTPTDCTPSATDLRIAKKCFKRSVFPGIFDSRPKKPCSERTRVVSDGRLELEVSVDQIVFLEAPQAFADLAGAHRADAVDRLEVTL